jgi:hypothetical protein
MSSKSPPVANLKLLEKMEPSIDRLQEAHFWIHTLEEFYHFADRFRWHLNAFLKSLSEVEEQILKNVQSSDFNAWFRSERERLDSDTPLLKHLKQHRDYLVHRGMLVPKSHGAIGLLEGGGFKIGFTIPIDPLKDSDYAMDHYLRILASSGRDPLALLVDDEDSLPCVYRVWMIDSFDDDILDLASTAWLRLAKMVGAALKWLGVNPREAALECRRPVARCQFKIYKREALSRRLSILNGEYGEGES